VIQEIIIAIVFLSSLGFVARLVYKSFQAKRACSSGCGKCSAVDFVALEKKISSSKSV